MVGRLTVERPLPSGTFHGRLVKRGGFLLELP